MIRAFPALALVGVGIAPLWSLISAVRAERRLPKLRAFLEQNRDAVRVFAGALLAMAVCFVFSIVVLDARSWLEWASKVQKLEGDPHFGCVCLRNFFGGWNGDQHRILRSRAPVYGLALLGFIAATVWAGRERKLEQLAVLGLMLLPIIFAPSNYYLHIVYVFPLLVLERRLAPGPVVSRVGAGIWIALLALCAAQYFTVLVGDLGMHFYLSTTLLLATLLVVFVLLLSGDLRRWLAEEGAHGDA